MSTVSKYMFARVTKECIHTTNPLKSNKHVISNIIENEFNRDVFNIKFSGDFDRNCLKDKKGNNLEYVVFVNSETKEKYHEHILNLNNYII